MKKITTLVVACLFASNLFAQQATLAELLARLEQNHIGSITDVFSSEELSRLRQYHLLQSTDTPITELNNSPLIHTTENVNVNYSVIDPDDVSTIDIIAPSPLADFEGAGATIPDTKDAIIVNNANQVFIVDPDGNYLNIGSLTPNPGESFTGLEYTSDGRLYGIATDGMTATTLYEIVESGGMITAMPIGGTGLVVGISLGRDANNELYALDIDTDLVHRINKTTAVATMLGPIGFDASFGQGMGFDPETGSLMCTCFNNTIVDSELRMINTTTGASTLVGEIVPPQTLQFGWMSFFDPKLGVVDTTFQNMSLAPNPAHDVLWLSGDTIIDTLKVYTVLGQLVLAIEPISTAFELNISAFKSGTYFISLESSGERATYKVIKQ